MEIGQARETESQKDSHETRLACVLVGNGNGRQRLEKLFAFG